MYSGEILLNMVCYHLYIYLHKSPMFYLRSICRSRHLIVSMTTSLSLTADTECAVGFYKCPNSYCLSVTSRCDGRPDCPGGEDEKHCFSNGEDS